MPLYDSWVGKICWRRDRLLTQVLLGFPCGSAGKESACNADRPGFDPWVVEDRDLHQEDPLEKGNATHSSILGLSCGKSAGKESACDVGDLGLIPGLGRSPGEGKGFSLQYSDLENSMD